jgi:transcription initiation factor TFIID TATA-box-binding protein
MGSSSMVQHTVVNIVGTSQISSQIDLNDLAMTLEGAEYEPEQFPGLVYRMKDPKAAFLIFQSGKVVCTGTRSPKEAQQALDRVIRDLSEVGFYVLPKAVLKIVNIVASSDLQTEFNLNQVAMGLGLENIEYEPEQFPGLVYRMRNPKVVMLLFSTGKVICTGATNEENVKLALGNLKMILEEGGFL